MRFLTRREYLPGAVDLLLRQRAVVQDLLHVRRLAAQHSNEADVVDVFLWIDGVALNVDADVRPADLEILLGGDFHDVDVETARRGEVVVLGRDQELLGRRRRLIRCGTVVTATGETRRKGDERGSSERTKRERGARGNGTWEGVAHGGELTSELGLMLGRFGD